MAKKAATENPLADLYRSLWAKYRDDNGFRRSVDVLKEFASHQETVPLRALYDKPEVKEAERMWILYVPTLGVVGSSVQPGRGEIIARWANECAFCDQKFVPEHSKIYDTGIRGPRGGKLMAHVGCSYDSCPIVYKKEK